MNQYATIAFTCLGLGLSSCTSGPHPPTLPPPSSRAPTVWVRAYSVAEFERELHREDAAARRFEAQGGVYFRRHPTPDRWEQVRREHPKILHIWRYEPDSTNLGNEREVVRAVGLGFVLIDASGRLVPFHESIGYTSTRTL